MTCPRRAPGFTLPEVLLAILLLTIGIVGLASSATAIAVETGEARRLTTGAALLAVVLDSLRAGDCQALTAGSRATPVARVDWRVAPSTDTRGVQATLTTVGGRRPHTFPIDALLPCTP